MIPPYAGEFSRPPPDSDGCLTKASHEVGTEATAAASRPDWKSIVEGKKINPLSPTRNELFSLYISKSRTVSFLSLDTNPFY